MSEERLRILKMLEEGKLTAEEAGGLLENVSETPTAVAVAPAEEGGSRRGRMVHVRVWEKGELKVQVNLPLRLARTALNLARAGIGLGLQFVPKETTNGRDIDFSGMLNGIDVDELMKDIEEGLEGKLVEVNDGDTKVEVTVK